MRFGSLTSPRFCPQPRDEKALAAFENVTIRRVYDEQSETWFFSVVDGIAALIDQSDYQAARNYWKVLKNSLEKEGSQTVTKCNALKMPSADGKMRLTDMADTETLLRLIQSIPSPQAEPFKQWLAKVGYERIQDMGDPALSLLSVFLPQPAAKSENVLLRLRNTLE
jgi:DNA-damage-inducible protein D